MNFQENAKKRYWVYIWDLKAYAIQVQGLIIEYV